MKSDEETRAHLQSILRDLEHLEEMREMATLNGGYSVERNAAFLHSEIDLLARKQALEWVLQD